MYRKEVTYNVFHLTRMCPSRLYPRRPNGLLSARLALRRTAHRQTAGPRGAARRNGRPLADGARARNRQRNAGGWHRRVNGHHDQGVHHHTRRQRFAARVQSQKLFRLVVGEHTAGHPVAAGHCRQRSGRRSERRVCVAPGRRVAGV